MKIFALLTASLIGLIGVSSWADVCGKIQKFEAQGGDIYIVTFDTSSKKSIEARVEASILASALTTVAPDVTLCFRQPPNDSIYDFLSASK